MVRAGSAAKLMAVLEYASQDSEFRDNLAQDVFSTLNSGRLDLSPGEILAMIDIVNNTSFSTFSSDLDELRNRWNSITI